MGRDETISFGGKEVLRFHPLHKKVRDKTVRCIACGQIDEPEWHERKWCPGMGGDWPFATSSLKLSLKTDSGFRSDASYRITLDQWVLISRILEAPDKVARYIIDDDGKQIGTQYSTVSDILRVEAFVDNAGTAWTPPTAWAYYAACKALGQREPLP